MKHLFLSLAFLALTVNAYALTLEWDRNTESDMATYHVYACATAPCEAGVQAGQVTHPTTTLHLPDPPVTTHFSVTAKDTSGNESGRSNTVTKTVVPVPDHTPPSAPAGLSILTSMSDVWGEWAKGADCRIYLDGNDVFNHGIRVYATQLRIMDGFVEIEGSGSSCGPGSGVWFKYDGANFVFAPVP